MKRATLSKFGSLHLVIVVVMLLASLPVQACRCAQQDIGTYFDQADVVAHVVVEQISEVGDRHWATVQTLSQFKGPPVSRFYTAKSSASCGIYLSVGQQLWLFATFDPSGLIAHSCNGTRETTQGFLTLTHCEAADALHSLKNDSSN